MALFMNDTKVKSVYWNDVKAKKVYFNDVLVLSGEFAFTYTGAYDVEGDLGGNFVIRFKTSGTLIITDEGKASSLDVFLVGGGGGGDRGTTSGTGHSSGGGGGGYTATHSSVAINTSVPYPITVGAGGAGGKLEYGTATDGGQTTAFGKTVNGGKKTFLKYSPIDAAGGGDGGSGGGTAYINSSYQARDGGIDGGDGAGRYPGKGQGTTTKEFGTGKLYSTGGKGGIPTKHAGDSAAVNTGDGGEGGGRTNGGTADMVPGGSGGSGIVCIRNHR